jgi:hypothetical protein
MEKVVGQEMGLVDEEEDETAFAGQVQEGGAELREETHKTEGRLDLEGEEDFAVQGRDAQVRVGEIDDGIEVAVEGMGESADGSGFASADVPSDEGGKMLLEGEGEAALDLLVTARREEVWTGDGLGKGGVLKAVEFIQFGHRFPPMR